MKTFLNGILVKIKVKKSKKSFDFNFEAFSNTERLEFYCFVSPAN